MKDWKELGACRGEDPDTFFPKRGEEARRAKRICATCEVVEDCLAYAMANGEKFGIWGGLSERQRRFIRNPQSERRRREQEKKARRVYDGRELVSV